MLAPDFAIVFDATLCIVLTVSIFWNFNRLLRVTFFASVFATKLAVSFCAALLGHTLLQLSTNYVDAFYQHPEQRFGLVRKLVTRVAAFTKQGFGADAHDGDDL